ncbi:hypothetical protein NM688_g3205 [Phlebia brevispora]|uniref:Uncharacterized protein n=1 Tax=Phlebia brevispora TaxID=194682 RepID=A0ACC1T6L2_9APHY|nr:hypothetical protein NM688_g3205 [Phlebia brevispora]
MDSWLSLVKFSCSRESSGSSSRWELPHVNPAAAERASTSRAGSKEDQSQPAEAAPVPSPFPTPVSSAKLWP